MAVLTPQAEKLLTNMELAVCNESLDTQDRIDALHVLFEACAIIDQSQEDEGDE